MGLEVWYPSDIRNALLAAEQATNAAAAAGEVSEDYLRGYRAALTTVALAFGLVSLTEGTCPVRQVQGQGSGQPEAKGRDAWRLAQPAGALAGINERE